MVEPKFNLGASSATKSVDNIDEGLRSYMLGVYNYMAVGTAITGLTAWVTANTPIINLFYGYGANGQIGASPLGYLVMFAPLIFIFALSFGVNRMKPGTVQLLFWAVTFVFGLSLANIFLTFTGASIARVFFITAGTFGAMSIYGYTTKRDLTKLGSFLMMGLIGIIIASLVNLFMKSAMMYFVISILGVLIFVGLTAYDTQKIKNMYLVSDSGELMGKKAVMGALTLYLDFINLFIMLLRLFGQRR